MTMAQLSSLAAASSESFGGSETSGVAEGSVSDLMALAGMAARS